MIWDICVLLRRLYSCCSKLYNSLLFDYLGYCFTIWFYLRVVLAAMLHVFEARARTQPHTGIYITTRPANTYTHKHTHLLKRGKAHIHIQTDSGTQTYCTCFYSHRVAHFLWFSHFSLFSRQPTSHVAGSSVCACASASARDRTSLVASHQPAAAQLAVCAHFRWFRLACGAGCPKRPGLLFFCCLIFISVLPPIPFWPLLLLLLFLAAVEVLLCNCHVAVARAHFTTVHNFLCILFCITFDWFALHSCQYRLICFTNNGKQCYRTDQ